MAELLLSVHQLKKTFPVKASAFSSRSLSLRAVDGVSFDLKMGETLGLVGESGCGKTTVGRCILRVYQPDSGRVFIDPDKKIVDEVIALDGEGERLRAEMNLIAGDGVRDGDSSATRAKLSELRRKVRDITRKADELARDSDLLTMNSRDLKRSRRRVQMVFQDPWASLNPYMVVRDIVAEGPREFATHRGGELNKWVMELLD